MTTATPPDFGRDIYCDPVTEDADQFMSEVTGVQLVKQDLRHRLMSSSVLGKDATGALDKASQGDGFFDLRTLAGATAGTAQSYTNRIKRAVVYDQRIASATVLVSEVTANGLTTVTVTIDAQTALGPFRLVFQIDPTQPTANLVALIVNQ